MHRSSQSCFVQAEGARADQAGVGAVVGGGEAGEEGRGAGQDDPGKDAHRGVGEVIFSNMTLSTFNKWTWPNILFLCSKTRSVGAIASRTSGDA